MVVGAAGCHHLGLWSMQGADGALLTTAVTPWSLLFTGITSLTTTIKQWSAPLDERHSHEVRCPAYSHPQSLPPPMLLHSAAIPAAGWQSGNLAVVHNSQLSRLPHTLAPVHRQRIARTPKCPPTNPIWPP
eukprot:EG_transcript_49698